MAVLTTLDRVQVQGGMGFIEEPGAAQHYRDARILPISEGTTAIRAGDLLGRKTLRDRGGMARPLQALIAATAAALHDAALADLAAPLAAARAATTAMANDPAFLTAKMATARCCFRHLLPETALHRQHITEGAINLLDLTF